jgi:GYF domain 2
MDWFIARSARTEGPLTFEAMVEAANSGRLGRDDLVWQPGTETWQRAGEVASLWCSPDKPPPPPISAKRPWLPAAVALIICGVALLIILPSLLGAEPDQPRPIKRDCAFSDYLKARCR